MSFGILKRKENHRLLSRVVFIMQIMRGINAIHRKPLVMDFSIEISLYSIYAKIKPPNTNDRHDVTQK